MASPTLDSICEDDHILDHEDNEVFNDWYNAKLS